MASLELCTHWVMDGFLTSHYTAKASCVLDIPIWGSGQTVERICGITSHTPETADAERLLALNRGHWAVEIVHHILDTAWDEDRCRIRTGHGPENTTRLRRFAIGVIRAKNKPVAPTLRKLNRKTRLVFDYLKMTENTLKPKKLAHYSGRTN